MQYRCDVTHRCRHRWNSARLGHTRSLDAAHSLSRSGSLEAAGARPLPLLAAESAGRARRSSRSPRRGARAARLEDRAIGIRPVHANSAGAGTQFHGNRPGVRQLSVRSSRSPAANDTTAIVFATSTIFATASATSSTAAATTTYAPRFLSISAGTSATPAAAASSTVTGFLSCGRYTYSFISVEFDINPADVDESLEPTGNG